MVDDFLSGDEDIRQKDVDINADKELNNFKTVIRVYPLLIFEEYFLRKSFF